MTNINNIISRWLKEYENFNFPKYEEFPDIDLYMDQVVTFLEKQLGVFQTSSMDKQITPSMINNYVKGEVITAPINKKYNKEHLALIEEICTLKQVLSIAEIKQIFDIKYENNKSEIFNSYKNIYEETKNNIIDSYNNKISDIQINDVNSLTNLALELAINANCYATISKRILFLIKLLQNSIKDEEEKQKKNKKIESEFDDLFKTE